MDTLTEFDRVRERYHFAIENSKPGTGVKMTANHKLLKDNLMSSSFSKIVPMVIKMWKFALNSINNKNKHMTHIRYLYLLIYILLPASLFASEGIIHENKTFNLIDFGAVPNDDRDDSEAFTKALDECRKNPGSTLVIPPGNYNYQNEKALEYEFKAISGQYGEDVQGYFFKPKGEYVIALNFDQFKDITVEAEGATLIQEGWYETISITNAKNVKIKGLTLVHKRPPFTTGTVVQSTFDYFDIKIDTLKYPYITDVVTGRVQYYDPISRMVYTRGFGEEKKKVLLDPETIRIYGKTRPNVNDLCILKHSGHLRAGVLIKESYNVVLEDFTIHSHPGMGVVGHRSENITLKNLQIIPAPGTVTSTNTDATHFTSCKGKITLDGCKFAGQGDDDSNIHNYYWGIYKENDPYKVKITVENADLHALSLDYPDVGDTISLVSRNKLAPVDSFIAKKVETSVDKWEVIVTLDKPFNYKQDDYYMTNLTRRPSVDIFNNTVRSHLGGYKIKTGNVHFKGNVMQYCSGTAIQLGAEADWRESGHVENVIIENNWIISTGYGLGAKTGSAINIAVTGVANPDKENRNIIIKNNVIQNDIPDTIIKEAIHVSGAKDVEIKNNKISGSKKAVVVVNSQNVKLDNNGMLPVEIKE